MHKSTKMEEIVQKDNRDKNHNKVVPIELYYLKGYQFRFLYFRPLLKDISQPGTPNKAFRKGLSLLKLP